MKIKVEYSESIQVIEGLWRKCGIEIENNPSEFGGDPDPQLLHNQAKEYVQRWHKEAQPVSANPNWDHNTPIPVVQRENISEGARIELLTLDINSCESVKVLESYKIMVKSNQALQDAYDKKMNELIGKTN